MSSGSITTVILTLLGLAAWRDLATRTIPDALSIAVATICLIDRAVSAGFTGVATSGLVAIATFALLLPLHHRGLVGGADVKLFSGLALGLSPLTTYQLVSVSVLCGGGLALLYLVAGKLVSAKFSQRRPGHRAGALRRIANVELWRIQRRAALPYGLAIAAGAAMVLSNRMGV